MSIDFRILILFATILVTSGIFYTSFLKDSVAIPPEIINDDYIFGDVVGVQRDENGTTQWILSGHWKTNLDKVNSTSNSTNVFNMAIDMTKNDGTSKHTHTLTDFTLNSLNKTNDKDIVFDGKSTISMREGPVENVSTIVHIMNNTLISILMDTQQVDNHFGNDPIYGIVQEKKKEFKIN